MPQIWRAATVPIACAASVASRRASGQESTLPIRHPARWRYRRCATGCRHPQSRWGILGTRTLAADSGDPLTVGHRRKPVVQTSAARSIPLATESQGAGWGGGGRLGVPVPTAAGRVAETPGARIGLEIRRGPAAVLRCKMARVFTRPGRPSKLLPPARTATAPACQGCDMRPGPGPGALPTAPLVVQAQSAAQRRLRGGSRARNGHRAPPWAQGPSGGRSAPAIPSTPEVPGREVSAVPMTRGAPLHGADGRFGGAVGRLSDHESGDGHSGSIPSPLGPAAARGPPRRLVAPSAARAGARGLRAAPGRPQPCRTGG